MPSSNQGREDCHQAKEDSASIAAVGRCGFEVEEIENGEALEGAAARDRVVARLVARRAAARAFGDIERDAEAGAVELVGEFGALERKPTNNVSAERQSESVSVPRGQAARSNR